MNRKRYHATATRIHFTGGDVKREKKQNKIKIINVMKDGRELESLKGIDAPDALYDILFKEYRAKGINVRPLENKED